jgi:TIR domain
MNDLKYQLVMVGTLASKYDDTLTAHLIDRMKDLGLDRQYLQILTLDQAKQIDDSKELAVMVWFGGEAPATSQEHDLLNRFLEKSLYVFPVVETLDRYCDLVPASLHHINGMEWKEHRLVADILRAFGLSRPHRQSFISYRRTETRNVAVQLFSELSLQGYQVFLDTASIDSGVNFQQALWGRMADVDLLIFLDSPDALGSQWVYEELGRAQALGLGILQLIWANHKREVGTDFSLPLQLDASDFINGQTDTQGSLTPAAIEKVLSAAESARIRSLAAKRNRVVGEFVDRVTEIGIEPKVNPDGEIRLYRGDRDLSSVIPLMGLPDAHLLQSEETCAIQRTATQGRANHSNPLIIYDSTGVEPDYEKHLEWLNGQLGILTCNLNSVEKWLKTL